MRRLILFRHSKTVAAVAAGDHARHLSPRGITEAALAAQRLWRVAESEQALVSDARRARETFDRIVEAVGREFPHRFEPKLYGASADEILRLVADAPETARTLLVIGHNPGLGDLARRLVASGDPRQRQDLDARFPTSSFAVIGLAAPDWEGAAKGGTLETFAMVGDD